MTTEPVQTFTLVLDHAPDDAEVDALYEVGCDDGTIVFKAEGGGEIRFDREAHDLASAIVSAVQDVERAGLLAVGVADNGLVDLRMIAERAGISYEYARSLARGSRGPGRFPSPINPEGPFRTYEWDAVAAWFAAWRGHKLAGDAERRHTLALTGAVLRVRRLSRTEDNLDRLHKLWALLGSGAEADTIRAGQPVDPGGSAGGRVRSARSGRGNPGRDDPAGPTEGERDQRAVAG